MSSPAISRRLTGLRGRLTLFSPSWGWLGVSGYFDDGFWVEVSEDAYYVVACSYVVPGWSVSSDDVFLCGVVEPVLFDVLVEGDLVFDVLDGVFWVVVSVVVESPEGVV